MTDQPFNYSLTAFKLRFDARFDGRNIVQNDTNHTFLDVRLGDSVKPLCIRSAHNLVLYTVSNWRSQWTPPRAEDQFCEACMSGASTAMILGQEKAILAQRRYRAGAWVTPAQAMRGMHRLLPTDHFYFKHFHMYQEAAA